MHVPNNSLHSVRDAWGSFFAPLSRLVVSLYFIYLFHCQKLSTFMGYNMQLFSLYEFKNDSQFQSFALIRINHTVRHD